MDSDWMGAVRLFSNEIPIALPAEDPYAMFPLPTYQALLKSSERGMWASGSHGAATQVVWLPRPGSCLVSTFDGAIMQLTQNVLDESPSASSPVDTKAASGSKVAAKESTKKPAFSKVIYRHTDSVCHMKILDNPGGVPFVVTATTAGSVSVLDLAGGKVSVASSRKFSFSRCSALTVAGTNTFASFDDQFVHIFDSQLCTTAKISSGVSDEPITAIASSGHLLALGTLDQQLVLIDTRNSSTALSKISTGGAIRTVAWNEAGSKLAAGGDDGHVQIWDVAASALSNSPTYDFKHADRVTSLCWSPEAANELVSVAFDGLALRHQLTA